MGKIDALQLFTVVSPSLAVLLDVRRPVVWPGFRMRFRSKPCNRYVFAKSSSAALHPISIPHGCQFHECLSKRLHVAGETLSESNGPISLLRQLCEINIGTHKKKKVILVDNRIRFGSQHVARVVCGRLAAFDHN